MDGKSNYLEWVSEMTQSAIDSEVEELLQVYRKRILLEDDGLADIEAAQTIKNLMLKHKLADATEYKKYYDKKLAQEANNAVVTELKSIRKNGTYLKRELGFAPGLWLKVDSIDDHIEELQNITADKEPKL